MMNETQVIHKLMDLLESLTPGGSEFSNDAVACHAWIKDRLSTRAKLAAERNYFRDRCHELEEQIERQKRTVDDE